MSFKYPRESRLLKPSDFEKVFAKARKVDSSFASFFVHSNSGNVARLGLAVSKRNFPKAVTRNRFRRLVRESFRQHQNSLVGFDIVVSVKRQAAFTNNDGFMKGLTKQWGVLPKK